MKEKNFNCVYRCVPEEQRETLGTLHFTRPYPSVNVGTTWLPLLGLLGWIAIYDQARAEEEILMMLAGEKYEKYRQRTGMFFPRLKGIH